MMEPIDLNGLSPMFRWTVVNALRRMAYKEGRRMESELAGWSDEPCDAKDQMLGWLQSVKDLENLKHE